MKVGRKLTYEAKNLEDIVSTVVKAKGSFGQVADLNNIPRDNFYYWLRNGEEDRINNLSTELAQFSSRLKKAQAEVVVDLCETALIDEKKSKFIMWWLSRICREDFGIEGIEIKELRDLFKLILPLIGKGEGLNAINNSSKEEENSIE